MMSLLSIVLLQGAQRPSFLPFLIQFIAIIAIFWFILIRPQRKIQEKHRNMLAALKPKDEIMTEGGIIGTVVHIGDDDRVTIKTAENTRIVVARPKIARVFTQSTETA